MGGTDIRSHDSSEVSGMTNYPKNPKLSEEGSWGFGYLGSLEEGFRGAGAGTFKNGPPPGCAGNMEVGNWGHLMPRMIGKQIGTNKPLLSSCCLPNALWWPHISRTY